MKKHLSKEEKYEWVERYHSGESASGICQESGVPASTFYTWLKPYKTTTTDSGHVVSSSESIRMESMIEKLEQKVEVLQTVCCTVSSPLQEKLYELEMLYGQYSVRVLCEALKVDRGTFYNHVLRNKKRETSYQTRRDLLSEQIKEVYEESNQIYGAKKIKVILQESGVIVSDKMVSELMSEMNLYSIRTGAKKDYKRFNYRKSEDYLGMDFSVQEPNEVWVGDITYFKLESKYFYLCMILDLYSRKIISYKISERQSTQLVTSTFRHAYSTRQSPDNLMFHSDRGGQYVSYAFSNLLKNCNVKQSLSPAGKPRHNAVMESFFANLKREELYRRNYRSLAEFKKGVSEYIDRYNQKRPHASIGYKTPDAYEKLFYERISKKSG